MTSRLLRFTVPALLAATLCSTTVSHASRIPRPVGWDRVVRPAVPAPIPAAGGGVYVPPELKIFPTIEFDNGVVDEPAEPLAGATRPGSAAMVPSGINSV